LQYYGNALASQSPAIISYAVEPFLPTILTHDTSATAYPPTRSEALLPLNLYFAWASPSADNIFYDAMRTSAEHIRDVALAEGQNIANAPLYPNYAIYGTPLRSLYGNNVPRLRQIKASVDPLNVMNLAGGWKF
jgi:hypothetical protein